MTTTTEYMQGYRSRPRFVYAIESDNGAVKIGYSHQTGWRLTSLRKEHSCETLVLAFEMEAGTETQARKIEKHAHWLLREDRLIGEWFSVSVDVAISAIKDAHAAIAGGARPPTSVCSPMVRTAFALTKAEVADLERIRAALGYRSMAAVIRRWIADARADTLGMEADEMVRIDGKEDV